MRKAVAAKPPVDFSRPETVVSVTIDPATGCLAAADSPEKRDEFFINGTEPTGYLSECAGDTPPVPEEVLPVPAESAPAMPATDSGGVPATDEGKPAAEERAAPEQENQ